MLHKAAHRVFVFFYLVILAVFLAALLNTFINPSRLGGFSFTGLIYPYLLLTVIVMTCFCVFYRLKFSLLGILLLAVSFKNSTVILALNKPASFHFVKTGRSVRIMTWNIHRFTPYDANFFNPKNNDLQEVREEIVKYDPDIICFQEFYTGAGKNFQNLEFLSQDMGYSHYVFSRDSNPFHNIESGTIILSRLPIIRSFIYRLPENVSTAAESPVAADIIAGDDTFRIGTFHMESYGFLNRDYDDLARIRNQEDTGLMASRSIFRKMRYAFTQRGKQADIVKGKMNESPYPLILCGDLNDVPNSYSYFTLRGKMNDAFLERGWGLGKTYISGRSRFLTWLPTLRIDYIFTDPGIRIPQFGLVMRKISDHRGLIADIELGEK